MKPKELHYPKMEIDDRERQIASFVIDTCVKVTLKKGYV